MYNNAYDRTKLPGNFILEDNLGKKLPDGFYPEDYVVIDIETTGLNPVRDEIIEISALRFSDNVLVDRFSTLVKPSKPIPVEITQLTGINNIQLETAENIKTALLRLREFLGRTFVIGYCVNFDISFLHNKLRQYLKKGFFNWYVDIHDLAKANIEGLEHFRQVDVCNYLNIPTKGAHRAENDCIMCNAIYQKLKEKLLEGYSEPEPRKKIEVTEEGLRRAPFLNKHFYFHGTMEISTKYDLGNSVIGLGAIEIDEEYRETTDFIVVGFAEESALKAKALKLAAAKKQVLGKPVIMREKQFIEALKTKNYIHFV